MRENTHCPSSRFANMSRKCGRCSIFSTDVRRAHLRWGRFALSYGLDDFYYRVGFGVRHGVTGYQ